MSDLRRGARALSFGSLNLDTVYQVPHVVRPGETLSSLGRTQHAGGKGLNQALALARAGMPTGMAGVIGRDGEELLDLLRASGVDVTGVVVGDQPTGRALIQVDPDGGNAIIVDRAANGTLTPAMIDSSLASLEPGDLLVLQNEVNLVAELAAAGRQRGLVVAFNPSPVDAEAARVSLDDIDVLIVNEGEACELTATRDAQSALSWLVRRHPRATHVVTLGERGAWAVHGTDRAACPAASVRVVDTTGAGDTFTGYFLASLTAGRSLQLALERASNAASVAITRPGAAESIPLAEEVDALVS